MGYFGWPARLSVAERSHRAARELAKLQKQGRNVAPVKVEGRKIARSFWGQSWCANLERYSDYQNRLPRGRSYVRNGLIVDLQIAKGEISAMVSGSALYKVKISVAPVVKTRWKAICRDCAGTIDSLVELLQGRLPERVMDRVCRKGDGLFPTPDEIEMSCSCPDWADMCKHVAATLYGVGARLDKNPQLIFVLRGVDENELLVGAGRDLAFSSSAPTTAKVLDNDDMAALFGLDMAENTDADTVHSTKAKRPRPSNILNVGEQTARTKRARPKKPKQSYQARTRPEDKRINAVAAKGKRVPRGAAIRPR
jgi:uncharacterized Zn finger protein